MSKNLDRAFDIMRERNRRYLEQKKAEDAARTDENGKPDEAQTEDEHLAEELRQAEEKRRAYQEQNSGAAGFYRVPTDGASDDELREAERKAEAFHAEENKLEKGDLPAMFLSAIIVFGPIFLVLIGLFFLAWLFLH